MPPITTPAAGATPATEGATPPPSDSTQQQPATPAPTASTGQPQQQPQEPATGDEAALGDAGKRALQAERAAKEAALQERDALKARIEALENASKSDQEKELDRVRGDAAKEERQRWEPMVRQLRVEGALRDAGCIDPAVTAGARDFSTLELEDDGNLKGLAEAVEAFKADHPRLFAEQTPSTPRGDFGNGHRSGQPAPTRAGSLEDAVRAQIESQGRR